MKKILMMSALLGCVGSACTADIIEIDKNNMAVSATVIPGTNDYVVELTQVRDTTHPDGGPAWVILSSDGTNDRIVEVVVKSKLGLTNQHIELNIHGINEDIFSPLAAFVDVTEHIDVELALGRIKMDGDLGQPSSQGPRGDMVFVEATRIDIKGGWYADVLVDDGVSAPTNEFIVAYFQEDASEGGFEYRNGDIPFFQSFGPVADFSGTVLEPFYIRADGNAYIIGAFEASEVDFDLNKINLLSFGDNLVSSTAIHLETL